MALTMAACVQEVLDGCADLEVASQKADNPAASLGVDVLYPYSMCQRQLQSCYIVVRSSSVPVFRILATSKLGKAGIMVQWYNAGLLTGRSRVSGQSNSGRSGGRIFFSRVDFLR